MKRASRRQRTGDSRELDRTRFQPAHNNYTFLMDDAHSDGVPVQTPDLFV